MLTRQELDPMDCEIPGCDHQHHGPLTLHASCHIDSPTWVEYDRTTGGLTVTCAACGRLVTRIAVADRPPTPLQ